MDAQAIVDTLAALAKAMARVEGRVEELAATTEAAADRAESAAERAVGSVESVTGTARAALAKVVSLQAEAQAVDRAARMLDEAQTRLAEVPVPAWKWLIGSAAAGGILVVLVEVAAWPALAPWLTPPPVMVAVPVTPPGTAAPTTRETPQVAPRERGHVR